MAPNEKQIATRIEGYDDLGVLPDPKEKLPEDNFKAQWIPMNVMVIGGLHLTSLYGLYLFFTAAQWKTLVWFAILYMGNNIGIDVGVHRFWSHRAFSAKWPLRLFMAYFQTQAYQNSIYDWARDHRVHHKYSETNADPHNAARGFFFSHCGWLMQRKHPLVIEKGKKIDVSDLWNDPIVRFQHNYYIPLVLLCCFGIPTVVPHLLWGESLWTAYFVCGVLRLVANWNVTWLVNSAAHIWGRKPYDKNIGPTENKGVSLVSGGGGFHNYHHTFPWDYASSELGYAQLNYAKLFIDTMAAIGLAYNLKTTSPQMIRARKERTGDIKEKGPYGPY